MSKGIYCYIDKENDKIVYVGKDSYINIKSRHYDHIAPSNYDRQPFNRIIQNNLNRYRYQILWEVDDCTDNHLNQMEIYFINKYNPKFNYMKGGIGGSHNIATKKKISNTLKGRYVGDRNPMFGRRHTDESKAKISNKNQGRLRGNKNPMFGKTHTDNAKQNISRKNSLRFNSSGFFRVSKKRDKKYKRLGFQWVYQYYENDKRRAIYRDNILNLKKEVISRGLPWKIIDKDNAKKSLVENERCLNE